jgi:hypothetical protein
MLLDTAGIISFCGLRLNSFLADPAFELQHARDNSPKAVVLLQGVSELPPAHDAKNWFPVRKLKIGLGLKVFTRW